MSVFGGHSRCTPHPADDGWSRRWLQEFSSSRGNCRVLRRCRFLRRCTSTTILCRCTSTKQPSLHVD